jgi:hypothetical protein
VDEGFDYLRLLSSCSALNGRLSQKHPPSRRRWNPRTASVKGQMLVCEDSQNEAHLNIPPWMWTE